MSIITSIGITIGFALAKSMISTWTSGAPEQVIHSLVDLGSENARGWFARRTADDSVERLAQQVVTAMTPLWQAESRGLAEGDRQAIVYALARTLAAGRIDAESFIRHRLDSGRLADTLAEKSAQETAAFSPDEKAVYRRLLGETCGRIFYIAHHVAGFEPLVYRHMLLKEDEVVEGIWKLLAGPAEAEREYEKEYRRVLPGPLERFDTIGIAYAEDSVRRLSLSEAYVDLHLKADPQADNRRWAVATTVHSGPIQEMLAQSARLVIRGQPGSGKSTLLRRVAVRAARRELHSVGNGLASWDDAVPFYLRLREFKDGKLPNPNEWPHLLTPMLGLPAPNGWTHRLLKDGRGVVLIDGVDEVAVAHRAAMLDALQNLVRTYPLARYVITLRPAAIKNWPEWNEWAGGAGFLSVTLQEMEPDQIETFVGGWHTALLGAISDAEERRKIRPLPAALKQLLRGRLALRRMARNPLLCTMICALHRQNPGKLPESRVELYQACVDMLLYKRDTARDVGSMGDYPPLTHTHEEVVLSEYAHHLLINADEEETAAEVETFFDNWLKTANMPGWDGPKLCDFLVKRTGLLIEPAEGQVAFAHRTFLEYLAAKAMVKRNDIKVLVNNAGDDQWRETILVTIAVPEISEKQSRRLLQGLLDKSQQESGRAKQELQLLAVACLESPIYRLTDLREKVLAQAAALIPPPSDDEVALLAKAGDPLVELLAYNPARHDVEMARCVDVLVAIGNERALDAIAGYSASPAYAMENGYSLRRAVVTAMWRFDPAEYCRRVFGHVTKIGLLGTQLRDHDLAHLADLSGLQSLDLSMTPVGDAGLAHLANLSGLQSLELGGTLVGDAGLAHLANLSGLRELNLMNTQVGDAGLAHLAHLSGLRELYLMKTQVSDAGLAHLAHLSGLRELNLMNTQVGDAGLTHLAHLSGLQSLDLMNTRVSDAGLAHLAYLSGLQTLYLSDTQVGDAGLAHLAHLSGLQSLDLRNTRVSDAGLAHLAHLSGLQSLNLRYTRVKDRSALHHLKGLKVSY